jgi:hypothetical protein
VAVVTSRSAWEDPAATFVGWKGSNVSWAWAHNHLDQGSFVYGADGVWFASDLGADSYSLPSYFWKERYSLYRTNTSGHNTLALRLSGGRGLANPHCIADIATYVSNCTESPLELFRSGPISGGGGGGSSGAPTLRGAGAVAAVADAYGIVNSTAAYAAAGYLGASGDGGRLARGFALLDNRTTLVVVDEVAIPVSARGEVEGVQWQMHTLAAVHLSPDGAVATLTTPDTAVVLQAVLAAARGDRGRPAAAAGAADARPDAAACGGALRCLLPYRRRPRARRLSVRGAACGTAERVGGQWTLSVIAQGPSAV